MDMKAKHLSAAAAGTEIFYREQTDSTNEWAKREGDAQASHGSIFWAGSQTAGKGRRGREWFSQDNSNLYFTILLRPDLEPGKISMLTLVMAYAVSLALKNVTGLDAFIKWPNDIVINGKKVCGILSEMKLRGTAAEYCVIGVGVNVGQSVFAEEIRDMAASLDTECGQKTDKKKLLEEILRIFFKEYEAFLAAGSLDFLKEAYDELLINKDKQVRVLDPKGEYEGIARGITATGELMVELYDGNLQQVYAGEVSVRGLYGYV